jgi:hypothetical protein
MMQTYMVDSKCDLGIQCRSFVITFLIPPRARCLGHPDGFSSLRVHPLRRGLRRYTVSCDRLRSNGPRYRKRRPLA